MTTAVAPRLGRPVLQLATALLVTRIGATAAYVGVALEVWRVTHSAAWEAAALMATMGLAGLAPVLTSPLADRFDRRRVMVMSQLLCGIAWLLLAAHPEPLTLVLLGVVSVLVESPFFVAVEAAIPNLVEDEAALDRANAVVTVTFAASWVVGPLLGAAVLGSAGVGAVFLLDAATSLVAAALVTRVPGRFQEQQTEAGDEARRGSAIAGLRVVLRTPVLRALMVGWFIAMLGFDGANVVMAPLAEQDGASAAAYSAMLVVWGLGLSLGAAAAGRLDAAGEQRGLAVSLCLGAAGLAGMGLAPGWWWTVVATGVAGLGLGCAFVADAGLVQRATPDAVRARTRAVLDGAATVAGLASMVLAAVVLAVAGPAAFLVGGSGLVVLGAVILRPRRTPAARTQPSLAVPASAS